jgi:hypothetical protein
MLSWREENITRLIFCAFDWKQADWNSCLFETFQKREKNPNFGFSTHFAFWEVACLSERDLDLRNNVVTIVRKGKCCNRRLWWKTHHRHLKLTDASLWQRKHTHKLKLLDRVRVIIFRIVTLFYLLKTFFLKQCLW